MIIDLILDRRDGEPYSAKKFYFDILEYRTIWPQLSDPITYAMDEMEEQDIKKALCNYIDKGGYNPEIKEYINSVNWL